MNSDKVTALAHSLVQSLVPGTSKDHLRASHLRNWALRELRNDSQGGTRREWVDAKKSLDGLAYTARVKVQDDLADALDKLSSDLAGRNRSSSREWDEGLPISVSNVAEHVKLLLNLSEAPSPSTQRYAAQYLTRGPPTGPTPDQVLYRRIMSDPFDGDHWGQGYDEEVKEGWSDSSDASGSSSDSSSATDHEILTPHSNKKSGPTRQSAQSIADAQKEDEEDRLRMARETLRKQAEAAYWRYLPVELEHVREGAFGWRDLSTGVAALSLDTSSSTLGRVRVITAMQLQREMLFALAGKPNLLIDFSEAEPYCMIHAIHPYVRQYSSSAMTGLLERLRNRAASATRLRYFAQRGIPPDQRTKAAFVEAVRGVIQQYHLRISDFEADLLRGDAAVGPDNSNLLSGVSTPLQLLLQVETEYGDLLAALAPCLDSADSPIVLLDTLYYAYTSSLQLGHASTALRLLAIFTAAATPTWSSLGKWLTSGMPIPSALSERDDRAIMKPDELDDEAPFDAEFFVKRDRDVSWADEDFWECAWVIAPEGWPTWLETDLRDGILEAGKARGLLRGILGAIAAAPTWKRLAELLQPDVQRQASSSSVNIPSYRTTEHVSTLVSAHIRPICDMATSQLRRVLEDECGLMAHLDAIEGAMYMRSYDVTETWTNWLYLQVRSSKRSWADFQTITSTYREAVFSAGETWMNAPSLRLSLTSRLKDQQGIAALGLIRLDYQRLNNKVPFPLSQLFSFTSMDLRADVFTALLQLGYGRFLLQASIPATARSVTATDNQPRDGQRLLLLKQRLLWVLDTIWIWLHDRVIELQIQQYRDRLSMAKSLGVMIQLELEHTRSIRKYCFLHDSSSVINGCLHDLLETTQQFADTTAALIADTASRPPALSTRPTSHVQGRSRARRRRHRSQRRGLGTSDDSTDDDEAAVTSEGDADSGEHPVDETNRSMSFGQLDLRQRVDKLGERLDEVMKVFKEGVEELANGDSASEAEREIWGMLRFALEDWRDGDDQIVQIKQG